MNKILSKISSNKKLKSRKKKAKVKATRHKLNHTLQLNQHQCLSCPVLPANAKKSDAPIAAAIALPSISSVVAGFPDVIP